MNRLSVLGISNNGEKVYQKILALGECTATELRKATLLSNSQVYVCIDQLIGRGLISYKKISTGRVYYAEDPQILSRISKESQRKIDEAIPFLKSLQRKTPSTTDTSVFEGFAGFKTALYQMARDCPEGETILIIGFSNQDYKNEKLAALLRDVNKISKQKKHKFKMILDNRENKFYSQRKAERISEIRFMERGFLSPAAIDVFLDRVYILFWGEVPYAFTIKNEKVAQGFKSYFEFLWNIAKK